MAFDKVSTYMSIYRFNFRSDAPHVPSSEVIIDVRNIYALWKKPLVVIAYVSDIEYHRAYRTNIPTTPPLGGIYCEIYACPYCGGNLDLDGDEYYCPRCHHYDIMKFKIRKKFIYKYRKYVGNIDAGSPITDPELLYITSHNCKYAAQTFAKKYGYDVEYILTPLYFEDQVYFDKKTELLVVRGQNASFRILEGCYLGPEKPFDCGIFLELSFRTPSPDYAYAKLRKS